MTGEITFSDGLTPMSATLAIERLSQHLFLPPALTVTSSGKNQSYSSARLPPSGVCELGVEVEASTYRWHHKPRRSGCALSLSKLLSPTCQPLNLITIATTVRARFNIYSCSPVGLWYVLNCERKDITRRACLRMLSTCRAAYYRASTSPVRAVVDGQDHNLHLMVAA